MLKVIYQQTGIEKSVSEFGAVKVWPMVVGEHIAKVSEVEKILYGVLHIKVKNAAWRNELTFKKKDIIAQLNIRIGKDLVQDIIFK
ncbi:MAG: DUF721 domain-containing protein [Rhizobacter sp.]|nr:DUF721 domain-containing protein [Chlorobiales bacterium]